MKCVVVGPADVGKSCLILVFQCSSFPENKVPEVLDVVELNVVVNNQVELVDVWDTSGQEDLEKLRSQSYKGADMFIICFSINNRGAFDDVFDKWYTEVRTKMPSTPILLVGTKSELRFQKSQDKSACVQMLEAIGLAKKIGASAYAECSAKSIMNVESVLKQAVKAGKTKITAKPKVYHDKPAPGLIDRLFSWFRPIRKESGGADVGRKINYDDVVRECALHKEPHLAQPAKDGPTFGEPYNTGVSHVTAKHSDLAEDFPPDSDSGEEGMQQNYDRFLRAIGLTSKPTNEDEPQPEVSLSPFSPLTPTLVAKIFSFLSPFELVSLSGLSKYVFNIANNDALWEALCQTLDPSFTCEGSSDPPKLVYQMLSGAWINDFSVDPDPV